MHRIVQDVQQLRTLLQQQAQIEHQALNLCNRIEQSAIQASTQVPVPLMSQVSPITQLSPITQATAGISPIGSVPTYNPAVLNQVMATEQQFRNQGIPTYGSQWQ